MAKVKYDSTTVWWIYFNTLLLFALNNFINDKETHNASKNLLLD